MVEGSLFSVCVVLVNFNPEYLVGAFRGLRARARRFGCRILERAEGLGVGGWRG